MIKIRCVVERITYQNPENGYSVLKLSLIHISTFGETLSWDYLCYARENPIIWEIPTHILYGEKDNLTAYGTIFEFVQRTNSTFSIMKNGEHWVHTDEQMKFLDEWRCV